MFGRAIASVRLTIWSLRLNKCFYNVKYISSKYRIAADAMYYLHTERAHDTETQIDLELPKLSLEDELNTQKVDNNELAIPEEDRDKHPKAVRPIPLEKMFSSHCEDLECHHYATTIGLS